MEMSGQLHAPAALPTVNSLRNSLDRKLSGLKSWCGRNREEKDLASAGNHTRAVQPIAHHYKDWAIRATDEVYIIHISWGYVELFLQRVIKHMEMK
jgi:hypothetical protein